MQQEPEKLEFPAYGLLLLEAAARMAPIDSGEVTSSAGIGSNVLNAGDKNWPVGKLAYLWVVIYKGAGKGQVRVIQWNAVNTLVIEGGWDVALNTTSWYKIVSPFDLRQALRDVLGGGSDISATNPLQVYDPKVGSLISFSGTTTADGAGDGSTLICADLAAEADFDGNLVIITSGDYAGQSRGINGVTTDDTVNPASAFGGQILSGTSFVIVGIRTVPAEVAAVLAVVNAIETKLDTPANFMANVAALALEASLGTHDTDIKALLGTIAGYIDAEVAAILASTGELQTDWADGGRLDLLIDAIKAKTDTTITETYFEQLVPIKMNCTQTITATKGDKVFIAANATGASGLISIDDAKVQKVMLLIIGRAVNAYAGSNALDCSAADGTPADNNQWQMDLDNGGFADLTNEEADGQLLDGDWLCPVEGAIHPFTFMFDVTTELTNIDGKIGVQLKDARSEQDSLIVMIDVYLKILWKL